MARFVVKFSDGTSALVDGERFLISWDGESNTKGPLRVLDKDGEEVMFLEAGNYKGVWRKGNVRMRNVRKAKTGEQSSLNLDDDEE